jgi:N6-adenosine-specific RNA methylase IME4
LSSHESHTTPSIEDLEYAESFARQCHLGEYVKQTLAGSLKRQSRSVRNLILAPIRDHSRKPDQMRADIERLFPGPYAELFARERAPGWDRFGNELDKFSAPVCLPSAA